MPLVCVLAMLCGSCDVCLCELIGELKSSGSKERYLEREEEEDVVEEEESRCCCCGGEGCRSSSSSGLGFSSEKYPLSTRGLRPTLAFPESEREKE